MSGLVRVCSMIETLPGTNLEVENTLFVEENGLPRGHAVHFQVSSSVFLMTFEDTSTSSLIAMASNLPAMATLRAMGSNLI